MHTEDDVKALAEKLGEVKFYRGEVPLKDISLPEEREVLARVALGFCEKWKWRRGVETIINEEVPK